MQMGRRTQVERRCCFVVRRTINLGGICGLVGLQDYAFDYVGYVFAFVDGGFYHFENFFPLDDLHGIFFFVEKLRDQGATQAVGVVFVAVDFDTVFQSPIRSTDGVDRGGDFHGGGDQYLDQVDGAFADGVDAIEHEAAGGSVDQVDNVVELG